LLNLRYKEDIRIKNKRITNFLEANEYDALVIGRQDNFSWITCGGSSHLIITSEIGSCVLIITRENKYIVAKSMDGLRIFEEQINRMDYEPIILKWYEKSIENAVMEILKNKRAMSDINLKGVVFDPGAIYQLHYPFTKNELEKVKWLSKKSEEIITEVAQRIKPFNFF